MVARPTLLAAVPYRLALPFAMAIATGCSLPGYHVGQPTPPSATAQKPAPVAAKPAAATPPAERGLVMQTGPQAGPSAPPASATPAPRPAAAAAPAPTPPAAATPVATPPASVPVPSAQAPAAAPAPAPAPVAAQTAAPKPPAIPVLPFYDAIAHAANNLLKNAKVVAEPAARVPLVIDPLIDGVTGVQSVATRSMGQKIVEIVQSSYPTFQVEPFNFFNVSKQPHLLIGTFTPIDSKGAREGPLELFRVCLALADLRTGKIVSKGVARSTHDGVDITPLAYFRESPAWSPDDVTEGYVKTCQGTKVGDPIHPVYWDRIIASALINDAMEAFNQGRYEEALDLYKGVYRTAAGDQIRVHNGVYLAAWKLGRKDEAAQAFGRIVDFGLAKQRLAVMFLFRPGSTQFWPDKQVSEPYPLWLTQIAERAASHKACIEVSGHTSKTGPEPLNERLSLLRAQFVKQRLETSAPRLTTKTTVNGKGSRENIVGIGTDDARDALDRRVEFKVVNC